ncbi:MAG: type IX secretion system membrane protein PorP/SprF [Saprospiraceae bacterium]|nr:type IX secretion system membrane protein PorP/SprF [Saprospiraceae bacterium]
MKQLFAFAFFLSVCWTTSAQDNQTFRSSLMQYQFNALPLNPAYAGRVAAPSFEAFYYGSFASDVQVSRSTMVSLHWRGGTQQNLGLGGVLQLHNQPDFNELSVKPAFARIFPMGGGSMAIGATAGVSYFDANENVSLAPSFMAMEAGAGAFWHNQRTFLGISMPNFMERPFFEDDGGPLRFRTLNLHVGSVFRITDEYYLKPAILLKQATPYTLNDRNFNTANRINSADLHLSVFVEGSYVVGVLGGFSKVENGINQRRIGISGIFLFNNFRFGYALQYNDQSLSNISLPATHTLTLGYDFFEDPEEGRRVF